MTKKSDETHKTKSRSPVKRIKKSEDALLKNKELYKKLVNAIPDVVVIADLDGQVIFVNDPGIQLIGYSREELHGRNIFNFIFPEHQNEAIERVSHFINGTNPGPHIYDFVTKDGKKVPCEVNTDRLLNEDGTPFGFVVVCRDITERTQAEETISKSEKIFSSTFHLTPHPMAITEIATGNIFDVNREFVRWSGYSREEVIGISTRELHLWVNPEDREKITGNLKTTGEVHNAESLMRQKNGNIRNVLFSARFIELHQKRYLLTFAQDITERKQAEEALRVSEEQHRFLTEKMSDIVWIADMNLKTTYISPSVKHLLGFTPEERLLQKLDEQLTPHSSSLVLDVLSKELTLEKQGTADPNRKLSLELEYYHKDGSTRWMDLIISGIRNNEGVLTSIHGVSRDITERKKVQDALKKTESMYHVLADNISEHVWIMDLKLRPVYLSPSAERLYGYTLDELRKISFKKLYTEESMQLISEAVVNELAKAFESPPPLPGTRRVMELQARHKDGHLIWVENRLHFIRDENGKPVSLMGETRDITEFKLTQDSLQKSEERYRTILEDIKEGYFETDLSGNFTFFNDIICKIIGYSREELMGMNNRQYMEQSELKKLLQIYNKVYTTGEINRESVWTIVRKDGTKRYIEELVSLLKDESGKSIGFRGLCRDITERKQIENLITESEEKYRLLADHTKDQVWLMDLNLNITYVSPSGERLLGYSADEIKKMTWDKLFTPESLKKATDFISLRMPKAMRESSKDLIFRTLELEFILKNGETVWGECSFSFIRDDKGKVVSILGEARNINDRKLAEEKLHQSEEKYRTILEDIHEGYFEVDLAGNFTFFNDIMCRIGGYSREELMGMNNQQYTDKEELKKVYQTYNQIYITGKPDKEFRWKVRRKDGAIRDLEGSVSLLKDSAGKRIGFRGIAHDITDRIQIEKKLQEEEQRFRALADQSSEIIIVVNREGTIIYKNPAVYILGINPEERIGVNLFELLHPDDLKHVTDSFHLLFSDIKAPIQKAELRIRHEDGSWRTFEAMGSNLVRNNVIEAAIVNLRDITERKQAEEKLQQTLDSLKKAVGTTIHALVSVLETKDPYTAGHQSRSANLACAIAAEMGLDEDKIEGLRMAGNIHDIGKLSVPTEILTKPTQLTNLEFSLIKVHPQSGYEMLKDVESPWPLAQIVHQHHERMNGSGYPNNLKGDEILIESRIMAVADVVEAMASHRPYRPSLGIDVALAEIEKNKGTLYDETVADACLKLFREKNFQLDQDGGMA